MQKCHVFYDIKTSATALPFIIIHNPTMKKITIEMLFMSLKIHKMKCQIIEHYFYLQFLGQRLERLERLEVITVLTQEFYDSKYLVLDVGPILDDEAKTNEYLYCFVDKLP